LRVGQRVDAGVPAALEPVEAVEVAAPRRARGHRLFGRRACGVASAAVVCIRREIDAASTAVGLTFAAERTAVARRERTPDANVPLRRADETLGALAERVASLAFTKRVEVARASHPEQRRQGEQKNEVTHAGRRRASHGSKPPIGDETAGAGSAADSQPRVRAAWRALLGGAQV